jgi:hypothetical protein
MVTKKKNEKNRILYITKNALNATKRSPNLYKVNNL